MSLPPCRAALINKKTKQARPAYEPIENLSGCEAYVFEHCTEHADAHALLAEQRDELKEKILGALNNLGISCIGMTPQLSEPMNFSALVRPLEIDSSQPFAALGCQ